MIERRRDRRFHVVKADDFGMSRAVKPVHLDFHERMQQREPTRGVVLAFSKALGVPLRSRSEVSGCWGVSYGQTKNRDPLPAMIAVDALFDVLEELPHGITELAYHPGAGDGPGVDCRTEHAFEIVTLCDGCVRSAITETVDHAPQF